MIITLDNPNSTYVLSILHMWYYIIIVCAGNSFFIGIEIETNDQIIYNFKYPIVIQYVE